MEAFSDGVLAIVITIMVLKLNAPKDLTLDAVKEVVYRNGTLRANFFRDIWRVEKVRKKFDTKEMVLFKGVLQEGKDKGVFHIDDVDMTASLVHYCVKGIEVPYIRGHIGANLDMETRKKYVANIVFGALHRTEI